MKRNIDILIEIQIKIYRFKFAADDISVMIDVSDAELSDLIKGGNKSTVVLMNMLVGITGCLDLLTEDIKSSMLNEGFDIDDFNEWTAKLICALPAKVERLSQILCKVYTRPPR